MSPSAATLQFGARDMHYQSTMSESYFNNSASPVTVGSISLSGPDASSFSLQTGQDFCTGQTIPAFGSCSLQVVFLALPGGPGPKSATLHLADDVPETVDVSLAGIGTTGTLRVDQSSLDLGAQVINQGNSNQQHVTLTNGPDAGVVLSAQRIIGPDASSFSIQGNGCQGFTVGPSSTCQVYVQFQPTSASPKHAQLELDSDGSLSPIFVSLTGVGLNGAALKIDPVQASFGSVKLGSSASQTFTLSDTGDAPLQIQGLFLSAGSPQVFPKLADGCSGRQLAPGSSCQITMGFIPIAPGDKDASLFLITNVSNGPGVTTVGLDGVGVAPDPALTGAVLVRGPLEAGHTVSCWPIDYPPSTTFSFQWLRNGRPIVGAAGRGLSLADADVGARFACRVTATAPGGSNTTTSPETAPVSPLDLSLLPGGLVDPGVCRTVGLPATLPGAVRAAFGRPVTPWETLQLAAPTRMRVVLDGHWLGSGTAVDVDPRTLARFADGRHDLVLWRGGKSHRSALILAPCPVAARFVGAPNRSASLTISSRTGISSLTVLLSRRLRLRLHRGNLGQISFRSPGLPVRSFYLTAARSASNGVTVRLRRSEISVGGLPPQVGVVDIRLAGGTLVGADGQATVSLRARGMAGRVSAGARLQSLS